MSSSRDPLPPHHSYSVLPYKTPSPSVCYQLGKKIGQGMYGTTYLCTDKSDGKEYACKTISKLGFKSKGDYDDVMREIKIMHHLSDHPNVVRIRETFEDSQFAYIIMELCSGGDLCDRIVQKGPFTEREAAKLTKTIVETVEACHSLGVMHRDIKPENFLFLSNDEDANFLKVIDFGLSCFFKPGEVLLEKAGSPFYIAPEVLKKLYGPEADVWSAGVVLYILLSGCTPFGEDTVESISNQQRLGCLDFESDPWPSISDSAKDLIRNMLNIDPKKRYTAHKVLCHPWIVDDNVAPEKPLDSALLSRLKQFSGMNRLKKLAIWVIAESLSEEQISGLAEWFKMMDINNSGTITFEKLRDGLRRLGSHLMESEIQDLMDGADINKSGGIEYAEFIAATFHLNKLEEEENLKNAFAAFDEDGLGYITIIDVKRSFRDYGLDDVNLEESLKEVDQNDDGLVSYNDFADMMRKGNGG